MVDWATAREEAGYPAEDEGLGFWGTLMETFRFGTEIPKAIVTGQYPVPGKPGEYYSPFRFKDIGSPYFETTYDPHVMQPPPTWGETAVGLGAPELELPKALSVPLKAAGYAGATLLTGGGALPATVMGVIGGGSELLHPEKSTLWDIGGESGTLTVDPLMLARVGKVGTRPLTHAIKGESLLAEKLTPKAFRMIGDLKKTKALTDIAGKDMNLLQELAEKKLFGAVKPKAGESLVKAAQREGLFAKGGIGFGTHGPIELKIPGSEYVTALPGKGIELAKEHVPYFGALTHKLKDVFGKYGPELEGAQHLGLITAREADEAGRAALSRMQSTIKDVGLPTEWVRDLSVKAYQAARAIGKDDALKMYGVEGLDAAKVDKLFQMYADEFAKVKEFASRMGIQPAELDIAAIDNAIDDLTFQLERVAPATGPARRISELKEIEKLPRFGPNEAQVIKDKIRGLNTAKQQVQSYITRGYADTALAFGRWLERHPKEYQKILEQAENLFPGDIQYTAGEKFITMKNAELARRMLTNLVESKIGFRRGVAVPKPKTLKERGLAAEIMAKRTAAGGPEYMPTEVYRSFRPDEIEPVVKQIETLMGDKMWSGWRKYLHGGGKSEKFVKHVPPKWFETDPSMALVKSWESIGKPVSMAQASREIALRWGTKLAKEIDPATGRTLEQVIPPGQMRFSEVIGEEMAKRLGLADYTIPRAMQMDVARYYRHANSTESINAFLEMFDGIQGWWKSQAILSPWFHSRNWLGGVWMGMTNGNLRSVKAGIHMARIMKGKGRFRDYGGKLGKISERSRVMNEGYVRTATGEKIPYKQFVKEFREEGIYGSAFWQYENVGTKTPLQAKVTRSVRPDKAAFELNSWAMGKVEEHLRGWQYIDARIRGLSPRQAGKEVAHSQYLYEALSPTERSVLKRAYPFYAFSRYSVPRQLYAALQKPRPFAVMHRAYRNLQYTEDPPPDPDLLPPWVAQQLGVRTGRDKKGRDVYWTLGNYLVFNDILQLIQEPVTTLLSDLRPMEKRLYELWSGQRLAIEQKKQYPIERVPGERGQVGPFVMGRRQEHLWRTFRVVSDLDRLLGPVTGIIPAKTERAAERIGDLRIAAIHILTGLKPYAFDREELARRKLYRDIREVSQLRSEFMDAIIAEDLPMIDEMRAQLIARGQEVPTIQDTLARQRRQGSAEKALMTRAKRMGIGAQYVR